jgi:YHS domain-containing protein
MKRHFTLGLLGVLAVLFVPVPGFSADETAKEALQALQEFIGDWKGSGGPDKIKPGPRDPIWTETISWSWRFKGDDVGLSMNIKNGKHFKSAEIRYLTDKKVYQLTGVDKADNKQVFTGGIKNENLVLERTDPDTKEVQKLTLSTNNEGLRFLYNLERKKAGSTLFVKDYRVAATREGSSLGAKESKNICVVSGGKGTIQVTYKGEMFYVCCSGCADAFKENPEKYIAEFKAKKNKE